MERITLPKGTTARATPRLLAREGAASMLLPLVLALALATLHQTGVFRDVDGRMFDTVQRYAGGSEPQVVVIERDAAFEALGTDRFAQLEAALGGLEIERIGYLGEPSGRTGGAVPVVTATSATPLPLSDEWQLDHPAASTGSEVAARVLPPAEYGVFRSQWLGLKGRDGTIAVFETALAGAESRNAEYLIAMPKRQSIPVLPASQIVSRELASAQLGGVVALIVEPAALRAAFATPLDPSGNTTSEAVLRAHAVHNLRSGKAVFRASAWEVWVILVAACLALAVAYRRTDPKRLFLATSLLATAIILAGSWLAMQFAGRVLPVTALLVAPWLVAVQCILLRERRQDKRLERAAARAVQHSVIRSALREGARLPDFVDPTARIAGVEKSLLLDVSRSGELRMLSSHQASLDDLAMDAQPLAKELIKLRGRQSGFDAASLVPIWGTEARLAWIGGAERDLFWIYAVPPGGRSGKRGQLVRAVAASFRELFRLRADLNARERQEEKYLPIDDKVASAISLVARESDQIRRGFDTIDTAVMVFHLIGSPLHANRRMEELYREFELPIYETPVVDALAVLTPLDVERIEAMLQELVFNGGEMRLPMRSFGSGERILRVAAPDSMARSVDRVIVIEAIDIADLHAAADLRRDVGLFIDLQLRNDLEAILLATDLATNPRVGPDKVGPVINRIGDAARRATSRLDEVAALVRGAHEDLLEACYPVDARSLVLQTLEKVAELAEDLDIALDVQLPAMSGFTIAEPRALGDMLEAMMRVVIADTPQGESVTVKLDELAGETQVTVSGGFGIGFGRLVYLLTKGEDQSVGEYRLINRGIARTSKWGGSVSYWGREAAGFGFNVKLRRIG
ncbi:hypothetical protein K3172_02025 [Qipengyuania sp. 6B39]|uniref:hypothetical protein n=1 Tax=Qipengyuania proteolytica TaxID=2867239 RepID=UPI001C89F544|nr:hypothetical protein [Qipengyuania proteolytica]MBX7494629.1 hypothetical protein [Qipengyuania proteolytica]